ncbi:MAG: alpha/beta fold hydrolase [Thermobifida fusca]|jgi:dienelactone hydrolase|uniref:alpha/beta hydrolase n=1 Tax=Thermobifida TaxID=83677 RepID=UPI0006874142|nr:MULTISPECIES: alpha/beta fold hydrolase [Thermobifida]MBO2529831.1 alpha/beta hydrolase [Thermobifida sp.]PZN64593.1 MAG: alpha/beta hydrolase [Thermobifida fusca]QOS59859.1 alpha/beta fold hydrolase [Thermobifida fusca]
MNHGTRGPPNLEAAVTGQTRREQVSFDSAGVACAGILYHPAEPAPGRQPCVVMAHGFTGTMDRLSHYAQRFADAGLTVLTFDYRNFGASGGQPRQLVDIAGQQADWHAAIRFARSRDDIDPDRIALWGSSLGGGHVLTVAADDQRIAAAVAQIPWLGDWRTTRDKLRSLADPSTRKLAVAAVRDAWRAWRGRAPLLVKVVGQPGQAAMFTDPSVRRALNVNDSEDTLWRNEFAPRAVFSLARYAPGSVVDRITVPVLVCAAEQDQEIPFEYVRKVAARNPRIELRGYPGRHWEVYRGGESYERVVADQLVFLRGHLGW